MVSSRIVLVDETATSFAEAYISPWLNLFSLLVGCFFASLCAFLSAVLLIGEADEQGYPIYVRKAKIATIVVVVMGFITITYGYFTDLPFVHDIVSNNLSVALVILSAICLLPLWYYVKKGSRIISRTFAGLQVILIIAVAFIPHFPNALLIKGGSLNLFESMAPDSVIKVLGISLIIGGLIILPGLFHLLKS